MAHLYKEESTGPGDTVRPTPQKYQVQHFTAAYVVYSLKFKYSGGNTFCPHPATAKVFAAVATKAIGFYD